MALTDKKVFEVRGRSVEVWAEKTALRSYVFIGKTGEHESRLTVFIGGLGDLQDHVDSARKAVADQTVSEVEHLEREAQID